MTENRRPNESSAGDRTRGRLLALLREGAWTVDDLADRLGLTDNAVRFHVEALELAGSIEKSGVRRLGVGQPAVLYSLSTAGEEAFSKAYAPVLIATLAELRERMAPSELMRLLKRIGKRLAHGARNSKGSMASRVNSAAQLLNGLGGLTEVQKKGDGYLIVGRACPLARAVRADHCVCAAVTSLVADVVGAQVTERCDRSDRPKCRFEIKPGTPARAIARG